MFISKYAFLLTTSLLSLSFTSSVYAMEENEEKKPIFQTQSSLSLEDEEDIDEEIKRLEEELLQQTELNQKFIQDNNNNNIEINPTPSKLSKEKSDKSMIFKDESDKPIRKFQIDLDTCFTKTYEFKPQEGSVFLSLPLEIQDMILDNLSPYQQTHFRQVSRQAANIGNLALLNNETISWDNLSQGSQSLCKGFFSLNTPFPTVLSILREVDLTGYTFNLREVSKKTQALLSKQKKITFVTIRNTNLGDVYETIPNQKPLLLKPILSDLFEGESFGSINKLHLIQNETLFSIPPQIGLLTNLTELRIVLHPNLLDLPSEIGLLTNLTSLYIAKNANLKEIPGAVGNLLKLQTLILTYNNMHEAPKEIAKLKNLETLLMVEGNQFDASQVPNAIKNLPKLKDTDVQAPST